MSANFTLFIRCYPQPERPREKRGARTRSAGEHLTMRSCARSNTALFRTGHGDQADVSTFQDAARAASRISRAQRYPRRACGAAQSPCAGPAPARAVAAAKRYGLDSPRRLRQKAQFERLLREGRRCNLSGFTFYISRRDAGGPRLGLLVTRKHAANASERNRIKRCIREAFRLEQAQLKAVDLLVRPPLGLRPNAAMIVRLRELLRTLCR